MSDETETGLNPARMVLATARKHQDLLAIVKDQSMLTYAQFARLVLAVAGRMQALGIGPDSRVSMSSNDVTVIAPVVLGAALLGAACVSEAASRHLPERLRPTHRLADTEAPTRAGTEVFTADWVKFPPIDPDQLPQVEGKAPLIYAPTSGTTGTPKILAISQEVQTRRALATKDDFVTRKTVFCTLFGADAYPFITRFISAFVNGATVVQSRDTALWYAAGVNHLYASVAQIGIFLEGRTLPRKLPLIHVSGARLSDALALHLLNSFDQVVDLYASTETNRSFKNVKFIDDDGKLATRGQPLDSRVEIVNDLGEPLAAGETGLVRVRNGYLATGYLDNPQATATSFRDGGFYTGDVAVFGSKGELQVVGRTGDILNLGGVKVSALAMDDALRALPGVADAMCFDMPVEGKANSFLAFVVPASGASMTAIGDAFRATILPAFGAARSPERLIEITEVPRAHDGGAKRFMCRSIYQAGRGG